MSLLHPPHKSSLRQVKYLSLFNPLYFLPLQGFLAISTLGTFSFGSGIGSMTLIASAFLVFDNPSSKIHCVVTKKVHLPTEREAEQLTGLQAGGISPLALINKGFQVIIDSSAQNFSEIHISGGQRGMNIKLPVHDLAKITNAQFAFVCTIPIDT